MRSKLSGWEIGAYHTEQALDVGETWLQEALKVIVTAARIEQKMDHQPSLQGTISRVSSWPCGTRLGLEGVE